MPVRIPSHQKTLFPEYFADLEAANAASSTFVDNMRLPVHRWIRYSAGFSGAWAQSGNGYELSWTTMDAGGGTSASADSGISVSGTIGQPDAGSMAGGAYTLEGGYWDGRGVIVTELIGKQRGCGLSGKVERDRDAQDLHQRGGGRFSCDRRSLSACGCARERE